MGVTRKVNKELKEALHYLWQNRWIRAATFAVPLLLLVAFVLTIVFQPPKLETKNTNLTIGNHVQFVQGKIAAYNGTSFFTIDPTSNQAASIVYTPSYRLPDISTVIWAGNEGVLLNFKSGIMRTPVQQYLLSNNIDLTIDDYFTWYLDFSDGSLSLVEQANLQAESAVYSQKENGFYYIPDIKYSDLDAARNTLRFYDIKTRTSQAVVGNLNLTVSSMVACEVNKSSICIVGRKSRESFGTTSIYSITRDGEIKTVVSQKGEIYPTPVTNTFALLGDGSAYLEVETVYSTVELKDISTMSSRKYTGNVFGGGAVVGMLGKDTYIIDGKNNEYLALRQGGLFSSTQTGPVGASGSLGEGISILQGQSDKSTMLIASLEGDVYAAGLSAESQSYTKASEKAVKDSVESCMFEANTNYKLDGNIFTIFINDDDTFDSSLSTFKECVDTPQNTFGYMYIYKGVSPVNGRISTD